MAINRLPNGTDQQREIISLENSISLMQGRLAVMKNECSIAPDDELLNQYLLRNNWSTKDSLIDFRFRQDHCEDAILLEDMAGRI